MYMRKLAAELMHMSRFDRVMIVSRAGMDSQSSSTPQKKPSLMSEIELSHWERREVEWYPFYEAS